MEKLNPSDLYDARAELGGEEAIVQDTVARFVGDGILPMIGECLDDARFPAELVPKITKPWLLGSSMEGCECAGLNSVSYGPICQELERGEAIGCFGLTDPQGGSDISSETGPVRPMLNLESVTTYEGTEAMRQLVVGNELTGVSAF